MSSLQLLYRTLYRKVNASKVSACQAAGGFVPYGIRLRVSSRCNIRTSCIVRTSTDEDNFKKGAKQTRKVEHRRGTSVFFAGSAQMRIARTKENELPPQKEDSTTRCSTANLILPTVPLGSQDWGQLKNQFSDTRNFELQVMEKMVKMNTDVDVAKSLLNFIAENDGDISYRMLIMYLVLCAEQNRTTELCDVYDIMRLKFQTLDTGGSSIFIKGLSKTDRWRESIDILDTLKKVGSASARNYADCVRAAVEHQEGQLAFMLFNEMLQSGCMPPKDAIQSLFDASQDIQDDEYRNKLIDILAYLRGNQIYPGQPLMKSIKAWFESIPNESWKGRLTKVTDGGHCQACKQQLESINLTQEEYGSLKKAVIDSIIKGENTFRKTTPKELESFLQFINCRPPYDIVVDGLNVAYTSNWNPLSECLLDVVSCLVERGRRVLVLGRKHMLLPGKKWVKKDVDRMQKQADCFFIDNISLDDPFLLYACMNSGSHCCFLTSDLLRDHKACLPDTETQRLFLKWQRGHQLVMPFYTPKKLVLRPILNYDVIVQNTADSWHIPYDDADVKRASFEVPRTWLCLRKLK
ncbi:mitochondrial ribonuclease P catalytic subunit [Hyperolius riggenbachi]|uniref:mitochondrial ribonuclease P catalytic subunit n=1 Tax=Hyperolius riggenbachi TaxID=752182 RepID=UPI0035A33007